MFGSYPPGSSGPWEGLASSSSFHWTPSAWEAKGWPGRVATDFWREEWFSPTPATFPDVNAGLLLGSPCGTTSRSPLAGYLLIGRDILNTFARIDVFAFGRSLSEDEGEEM